MLNILIAGVGGQGNVLASRVIAECAIKKALHVKTSETIGMAQREGAVVSHVRIGKNVNSSLIAEASGDILIGMELAEATRSLVRMKPQARIIVNDYAIIPAIVSIGKGNYNMEQIKGYLKNAYPNALFVPASIIADKLGNIRATNVVMLGFLAGLNLLPFESSEVLASLKELLPTKLHDLNQKAFEAGLQEAKKSC